MIGTVKDLKGKLFFEDNKPIRNNEKGFELDGKNMGFDEVLNYLVADGMTSMQAMNFLSRKEVY